MMMLEVVMIVVGFIFLVFGMELLDICSKVLSKNFFV
jgi:hypothetical protein